MRSLIIILMFAFLPTAMAETNYSKLLHYVQQKYLKSAAPYPILIMDRDEIEQRFLRADAASNEKKRQEIIQQYVWEKTGVKISDNAASNFEPYLTVLKDSANALPALRDDFSGGFDMCAIFPADPNRSQQLETERLLQLTMKEVYGDLRYAQLKETLSYSDFLLYSVLHESGHCMDQTFFAGMYKGGGEDAHSVHQAESFAETVATLLMAQEGRVNVARIRADLRSAQSYFMEPYFAGHPEKGFGSEIYPYAGLVYFLAPSILAAGAEIDANLKRVQGLSLAEALAEAKEIVLKNSIPQRLFTAIYVSYAEGRPAALARYEDFAAKMPDLFAGVPEGLKKYIAMEDALKESYFDRTKPARPEVRDQLAAINYALLCESVKEKRSEDYLQEIDRLRLDLQKEDAPTDSLRARSELLRDLWKTLPGKCNSL